MTKDNSDDADKGAQLSRRGLFGGMAAAGAARVALPLAAQAQAQPPAAPPAPAGAQVVQNGEGPIRVLFISAFHPYDHNGLFGMLDGFGEDISWTHVDHPAAEHFFDPELAKDYDVFLFYDAYTGRKKTGKDARGRPQYDYLPPSAKVQSDLKKLMTKGDTGFVFLHHAIAAWVHSWPAGVNGSNAYVEVMGAAADWGTPLKNIRGVDYPASGAKGATPQRMTVVDKTHPITQGVSDFDITDETYLCPMFEDSVHCLLRTNFTPTADKFPNRMPAIASHPPGSTMAGWVKTAENTPVAYLQNGHDNSAWNNPNYQRLVLNAIKWAASAESKTWAKANPKRIFV